MISSFKEFCALEKRSPFLVNKSGEHAVHNLRPNDLEQISKNKEDSPEAWFVLITSKEDRVRVPLILVNELPVECLIGIITDRAREETQHA
jgi:hypothetical protein